MAHTTGMDGLGLRVPSHSALLTDWYQFPMLSALDSAGMAQVAVFEWSVRHLPPQRRFLLCAGLEQVLRDLESWSFSAADVAWLAASGDWSPDWLARLSGMRFTGDVDAMPEGSVFFQDEPILRITAPIAQAQWMESRILNTLHYSVLIASKAARCVLAAPGKLLIDFGLRRAPGVDAALMAARSSWLAGFDGTATVLAKPYWGIPLFGTMAHSFIEVFAQEAAAFDCFARAQPHHLTVLLDTYDTQAAAHKVVACARQWQAQGIAVQAVRIDSGDLAASAHAVRHILDAGGLQSVRILASGGLDEIQLRQLVAQAPFDGFGLGTALVTSSDVPALDAVYKLCAYGGIARRKRSEGKAGWPGAKQVYRRYSGDGVWLGDTLCCLDEPAPPGAQFLLAPVMRGGRRVADRPPLAEAREYARTQLASLPYALRDLDPAAPAQAYPIAVSPALQRLAAWVDRQVG